MTEKPKSIYENRDFMLGEIHAATQRIPDLEKKVNNLGKKVAVIEWKSGLFGTIGGMVAVIGWYVKNWFSYQ